MNGRPLKNFARLRLAVLCTVVLGGVLCFHQQGQAQPSAQQALTFNDPLKQINWISGPQSISVGSFANINIPRGYRLTDARGARIFLDMLNTPVPDDVVAVLASDSGKWRAVLEYSSKGYVKDADVAQINSASLLKAVQKQIKAQDIGAGTSLNWDSPPVYDPQTHSLAWSLQIQSASAKTLKQAEVLLGRHGFIEVTAVQSYPLSAAPDLKQLTSNISFKDGERYSDYQNGDKIAEIRLAELITGQKPANPAGIFSGGFGGAAAAWVYSGLALLTLGGLFVLRTKNRRRSMRAQVAAAAPAAAQVVAPAAVAVNAAPVVDEPPPVVQNDAINGKNGGLNGHSQPKVIPAARNGAKLHRHRRKRVFDYSKFYTSVVKELSLHSYGPGTMATNGKFNSNGHSNGYQNGHANGHSNGHVNGNGTNGNGSGTNDVIKSEIEQLIATQKNLIQEQKCLLEQQTKLIEEKRWLIQEQSAFLKGQANLIDEQQFPLKFE